MPDINFHTGNVVPPAGCDRDFLYANQTTSFDGKSVITGIPLSCIDGVQYATFCNDGTNDLSSANLVCTLYGYYGELAFRQTIPFAKCSSLLQAGFFHCEIRRWDVPV